MKIKIRNERIQSVPYLITDRPVEVKTTSLSDPADSIPPMSEMTYYAREGDVLVLTAEGGIKIEKEQEGDQNV